MSFSPIAYTIPNYRDFKNYWLKAYEPGTTTPKSIGLNGSDTLVSKVQIDKDGFTVSAGSALIIPYISGTYDLWAFPTVAEADANDTSNALRFADNIQVSVTPNKSVIGKYTLAEAVALTTTVEGQFIQITDRGNAQFEYIAPTTNNGYDLIEATGSGLTLNLVENQTVTAESLGLAGGTDEGLGLERLFTLGAGKAIVLGDSISYESSIDLSCSDSLKIIANNSSIDMNGGLVTFEGAQTLLPAKLVGTIKKGSPTITTTDATGIEVGDYVVICDSRLGSFNPARDSYLDGEIIEVSGFGANTDQLVLASATKTGYDGDPAINFYKLDDVRFDLGGLTVKNGQVTVKNFVKSNIDINAETSTRITALSVFAGMDSEIKGNHISTFEGGSQDYGLAIRSSQNVTALGGTHFGGRHGVALTAGGFSDGQPPNRNVRVVGAVIDSKNSHAADMHGCCSECSYVDCQILNGAEIGGENVEVRGGSISCHDRPRAMGQREIKGGYVRYSNIQSVSCDVAGGVFFGQHSSDESDDIPENFSINIENVDCYLTPNNNGSNLFSLNLQAAASIRYDFITKNVRLIGSSGAQTSRLLFMGSQNLAKLRNYVIDIDIGEQDVFEWDRDTDGAFESGVTKVTYPVQVVRQDITAQDGQVQSDEVTVSYPVRYISAIPSFTLSRLQGKTDGGTPYLLPFITRANGKGSAIVRLTNLTGGAVSPARTERYEIKMTLAGVTYDSSYKPV